MQYRFIALSFGWLKAGTTPVPIQQGQAFSLTQEEYEAVLASGGMPGLCQFLGAQTN
jgi:hypothetical protein